MEINQITALIQNGCGSVNKQSEIISYLLENGWAEDGKSSSRSYKIITTASYPLPGAIIHQGNRPRFIKGNWKVTVGKFTTYFYLPENGKPSNQWLGNHFNNSDIEGIKSKAEGLK